ncbi:DUF4123 domain-containing protein [Acidovorax cavernicola]|uniref:DUF4123 domain-containing protein n=1 Tax=Acidovorax cavernicola TaxID=1675792 RepID=A0A9X8GS28_9BURK|nr:DUF4123 domain-containing protein [Acidovorax cavernicola]RIX72553.1 DUF4123 domain-containing protein [Acidovorax cavernicola]
MSAWNALDASTCSALALEIEVITALSESSNAAPYLLLDQGEADFLPGQRVCLRPIPDSYFKDEPSRAPHLLPLKLPADHLILQEALASAILTAPQRLHAKKISALLLISCDIEALLAHFRALSLQYDPTAEDESACVMRYQDPRVMQRVWPILSEGQRRAWLGPIRHWYAATQPTGPIVTEAAAAPTLWHATPALSDVQPHSRVHHLLDSVQWRLAHGAPSENSFWQVVSLRSASGHTAPYPSTGTLRNWLSEAASSGLGTNDQTEWALCQWGVGQDYWQSAVGQRQSCAALEMQKKHAGLGFSDAWHMAGLSL